MNKANELAIYGKHLVLVGEGTHPDLATIERLALVREPTKASFVYRKELIALTPEQEAAFNILLDRWSDR